MRLIPSDPDIKTIVNRIKDGDINLQPDFQRGEVWGETKKVRLIDSILREWHVPPIHVVEIKETGKQDVLDGQQRLVAIRDFVKGLIEIDGRIEPLDQEILQLDGLTYGKLPEYWRRRFDKFTIRIYNITDYLPSEPGELFYRLNQPTNLTSAEQRNAFYGPAREQVKYTVEFFEKLELTRKKLGFSNSRMAYDDVIARLCVFLDSGKLSLKVTANVLADRYRSTEGFSDDTMFQVQQAIIFLSKAAVNFDSEIKFNKATLLSWLIFITQLNTQEDAKFIGEFIGAFEKSRSNPKNAQLYFSLEYNFLYDLFSVFNDRASSRVADISSVLIRDFIIWTLFVSYSNEFKSRGLNSRLEAVMLFLRNSNNINNDLQDILLLIINDSKWGNLL